MKRITRLAVGLLTGPVVTLALVAPSSVASADTGSGTAITFEPDGHSPKAGRETIHCVLTVSKPRFPRPAKSVGTSGTDAKGRTDSKSRTDAKTATAGMVKAEGRVKCDQPVAGISVRAGLYKDGLRYKQSDVKALTHTSDIVQRTSHRCVPASTYTSAAITEIKAPSGYTPRQAGGTAVSKPVRITACARSDADPAPTRH
ncbi:hypothetical protein DZF91_12345 [Actinomadura logoneensis]|uniref:Prealbumin-like fold domain-containing protein n=1 Tax=Actinomadura logoneensis TaxID=2293572 RepID=A0A372JMU0_9ACTN|nr:hypothetical protein [Actinomadura logoneensis]RFU41341.1 hypothetical protein DZF91_12345 [Actinomadura logoneensis]